ncbi:MAG TPA: hypothetical protein VFI90_13290 [Rubrobacter sp.]|nr:hypothetical protein [Rubrobacter sp.]
MIFPMIPHIAGIVLTPKRPRIDLLVQLDQGEPEVLGHTAVPELLSLADTPLVSSPRLVLAPEYLIEVRIRFPFDLMSVS